MHKTLLTETDFQRLAALAASARRNRRADVAGRLDESLRNALVFGSAELADGVVSMRSDVTLREAATGEEYAYRLVFPADADVSRGRLSVLTPLGAALLGRRSGESFVYESPGGPIEVAVVRVESGPDGEDDYGR